MNQLDHLIFEIIRDQSNSQRQLMGIGYSQKKKAELKKFLKSKAKTKNGSDSYTNIQMNSRVSPRSFVSAFGVTIDTGFKLVVLSPFYFSKGMGPAAMHRELREIIKVFRPSRLPICISFPVSDKKLLRTFKNARGWKFSNMTYVGNVAKAVEKLKKFKISDSEISFRKVDMKHDLEEIYHMELTAFKKESNSILSRFGFPTKKAWFKAYRSRKFSLVATHGKIIVGYIAFEKARDTPSTVIVSSLSVRPAYQGLGISKLLYKAGFECLRKAGIRRYLGFSSTPKVMKMAKLLGRQEVAIGFYIPGKKVKA
jgi:GNAT superfamily N-acetyltransferase